MNRVIAPIMFLSLSGTSWAGPVLLGEFHTTLTGSSAPQSIPELELILQVSPTVPLPLGDVSSVGQGTWWTSGQAESIDFSASNSPGFIDLATRVSDGLDDRFAIVAHFREGNQHGIIDDESILLGAKPDLIGYRLDFVRLTVSALSFEPITIDTFDGLQASAELSYAFYGEVIPLPSTLFLLGVGSLILTFKRKKLDREFRRAGCARRNKERIPNLAGMARPTRFACHHNAQSPNLMPCA